MIVARALKIGQIPDGGMPPTYGTTYQPERTSRPDRHAKVGGQIQIVRPWSEASSLPSSGMTASVIQQLLNSPSLCLESTNTKVT